MTAIIVGVLYIIGTVVPVVDRQYPLDEVVDAIKYLAGGHARSKVVFMVNHHSNT
jgi:NADPH:quinone reductase-like Zn-dependent oxidoreductase